MKVRAAGRGRANASRLPGVVLLCALLAGCAGVVPSRVSDPTGSIFLAPIRLDGGSQEAHWYLPAGEAPALLVFEHGFLRHCENLRETSRRLMAARLVVLCVDASMRGGNPALAEALARSLVDDRLAPGGRPLPRRILVAGHSAGALFAVDWASRVAGAPAVAE